MKTEMTNVMREIEKVYKHNVSILREHDIARLQRYGFDKLHQASRTDTIYGGLVKAFDGYMVVNTDQIIEVCKKMNMTMDRAQNYKAEFDLKVLDDIEAFEKNTGFEVNPNYAFVIAPEICFEKPVAKDPVYLIQVWDNFFVPIAKWGDDIKIKKRLLF